MNKSRAKRFTPQLGYTNKCKPSKPHKENNSKYVPKASEAKTTGMEKEPVWNDSEKTKKITKENNICENEGCEKKVLKDFNSKTRTNITKIKESIKEILDESVKVHVEMRKLREKLESNQSFRENSESSKKVQIEFDVSSIKSSPAQDLSFSVQMGELKHQLTDLNDRLLKGEERIKAKSLENYSLQFTIFTLQSKLEKIKQKSQDSVIENSKCKLCLIF